MAKNEKVKGSQEFKCSNCGTKETVQIFLDGKSQTSDFEWLCKTCGATKRIVVSRKQDYL